MRALVGYLLSATLISPVGCAALVAPVDGPIIREFAPINDYEGHWGVDYGVEPGTAVQASGWGRISFAGVVAEMKTVTIDHGGGLKSSYSFLSEISVVAGQSIATGERLGHSGIHYGTAALHFSTRLHGTYQDPVRWMRCGGDISAALWLSSAYPFARATRHSRRNLRSATLRSPLHGRSCLLAARPRRRHVHSGGRSVAKGRPRRR